MSKSLVDLNESMAYELKRLNEMLVEAREREKQLRINKNACNLPVLFSK